MRMVAKKKVKVGEKVFLSISEAARCLGVCTGTIASMVARGEAEFLPTEEVKKGRRKTLLPGETSILDLHALARERGIKKKEYYGLSKRELADLLGVSHLAKDGRCGGRSKPVRVGDESFPSMTAAAKYFGVVKTTITYWVATGKAVLL